MIKTPILFVLLCSVVLNAFPQRVNKYGQKIVKNITVIEWGGYKRYISKNVIYEFGYDKQNNLTYLKETDSFGYREYVKTETSFVFKTNIETLADSKIQFEFDLNDHVARIVQVNSGSDGCKEKTVYDFGYGRCNNGFQLNSYTVTEFYKPPKSKIYYKQDLVYHKEWKVGKQKNNDKGAKHNLNINIFRLLHNAGQFYVSSALELTEWMPNYFGVLPYKDGLYRYEYKYDDYGNLIEIDKYSSTMTNCPNYLKQKITITYVY